MTRCFLLLNTSKTVPIKMSRAPLSPTTPKRRSPCARPHPLCWRFCSETTWLLPTQSPHSGLGHPATSGLPLQGASAGSCAPATAASSLPRRLPGRPRSPKLRERSEVSEHQLFGNDMEPEHRRTRGASMAAYVCGLSKALPLKCGPVRGPDTAFPPTRGAVRPPGPGRPSNPAPEPCRCPTLSAARPKRAGARREGDAAEPQGGSGWRGARRRRAILG